MDPNTNPAPTVEGICVAIRMRPLNERELNGGQEAVFRCTSKENRISQLKDNQVVEGQTYYYDKVFDERATTAEVYTHVGRNAVKNVAAGINGTIFAYGQTSSGKTHTMLGGGDQRGVLEMAAEDIFNQISESSGRDFLLRVSFVEIYNEMIRDLLSDAADTTVTIREDPKKGVYCDTSEIIITDYESIIKALRKGISKRAVEATSMNDTSSRSHTIFKLVVESKESSRAGVEAEGAVLVASLNLVDLAGSESVRHTGATGQRAKEGGKINQSLLSLSRVIHSLSQPGTHVSFRDSKLTRLLQPSLSGNAKMAVVCCVTPSERYIEETRSTLQFASRAKLVKTNATVNEVVDDATKLKRLKKELEQLKDKQRLSCGMSEEEGARIEDEKNNLLSRLEILQREKDQQKAQLECLRGLVGEETVKGPSDADKKRRKKRQRDTWCPGAALNSPLPSKGHRVSHSPIKAVTFGIDKDIVADAEKENDPTRRSSADTMNSDFYDGTETLPCKSNRDSTESQSQDNMELSSLREQLAAKDLELSAVKTREQEGEKKISELTESVHVLEHDLATLQDIIGQCGGSGDDQSSEEIEALKKEISSLKQSADSVSFLNDQLMSSHEVVETLEAAVENLNTEVAAMGQARLAAVTAFQDMEIELVKANEFAASLQSGRVDVDQTLEVHVQRITDLETASRESMALIAAAQAEAELLRLEKEVDEETLLGLREELEASSEDLKAISAELVVSKERDQILTAKCAELEHALASAQSESVSSKEAEEAIHRTEEARDIAASALQGAKDELEMLQQMVESSSTEQLALEEVLVEKDQRIAELEAAIVESETATESAIESLNTEIETIEETLKATTNELKASQESEAAMLARCAELEALVAEKEECLERAVCAAREESESTHGTTAELEEALLIAENARDVAVAALEVAENELMKASEASQVIAASSSSKLHAMEESLKASEEARHSSAKDLEEVELQLLVANDEAVATAADVLAFKALLEEKVQHIALLEAEISASEEQRNIARASETASESEYESMRIASASEIQNLKKEIQTLEETLKSATEELTAISEGLTESQELEQTLTVRCTDLAASAIEKDERLIELERKLTVSRRQTESMQGGSEESLRTAEDERDFAVSAHRVAENELVKAHEQSRLLAESAEAEKNALEAAIADKDQRIGELEEEKREQKSVARASESSSESVLEELRMEIEVVEETLKTTNEELEASKEREAAIVDRCAELEALVADKTEIESLNTEIETIEETLKATTNELKASQESEAAMLARCAELEALVAEKEECLERAVCAAREESESTHGTTAELEEALLIAENARDVAVTAHKRTEGELKVMQLEVETAQDERVSLEEALEAKDERIAELELQNDISNDNETLSNANEKVRTSEIEALKLEIQSINETLQANSDELKAASDDLTISRVRESVVTARCSDLEVQVSDKEECLVELERALNVARVAAESTQGLERALRIAEEDRDVAISALQSAENEFMKASEASQIATESHSLGQEEALAGKDQRIAELEAELENVASNVTTENGSEVESLKLEIEAIEETLKATINELKASQESEAAIVDRCAELEALVADKTEIESLNTEIETIEETLKATIDELKASQESEAAMLARCAELEALVAKKEECLERAVCAAREESESTHGTTAELEEALLIAENARDVAVAAHKRTEGELKAMQLEVETAVGEQSTIQAALLTAEEARDAAVSALKLLEIEVLAITEARQTISEASSAELLALEEALAQKDLRIAELQVAAEDIKNEITVETESLKLEIEISEETLKATTEELAVSQTRERSIAAKCVELEMSVSDKEECLVELERALGVARVAAENTQGLERALRTAEEDRDVAISALQSAKIELEMLQASAVLVSDLEEALANKDEQIAELQTECCTTMEAITAANIRLERSSTYMADSNIEKDSLNRELEKMYEQVEELTEALMEEREVQETDAKAMKSAEIDKLNNEIELLQAELNAANECIEAELQQQEMLKESSQGEVAELVARLEIAAQELTAQQKCIDLMKDEEKERIDSSDNGSLMAEMNALLEAKIEAVARALKAESDSKLFQDQLSTYDRNTAEEQEIIMKMAEAEMTALRGEMQAAKDALQESSEELQALQERDVALTTKCEELERDVADKEECILSIERALAVARRESDSKEGIEEALLTAEDERDSAVSALKAAESEMLKSTQASRQAAKAAASQVSALEQALEAKDERIAHLELSKLTQEQMDKIKVLKEDHKKSREDVKTMKKQLSQLKKAYDDLKESSVAGPSAAGAAAIAAAHSEIATLTDKLQESASRLESVQNIAKALKEKIRDCSKQLQEYEAERTAVVKVLEAHGVDTKGLQLDTSIAEDDSVLYQDLSDVVSALAEKLTASRGSERLAEKVKSLQESLTQANKEADELKALKCATEKRLEASKAQARGSRAEAATVSAEVDFLREQLEQRTEELTAAQGKITGSVDSVSSEVQALEEENIELMKENMELRKETSTYRLEVEKVKAQLIKASGGYTGGESKVKPSVAALQGRTPQPSETQSSRLSSVDENISACEKTAVSVTKSLPAAAADSENKLRRSRKAKPLVDTNEGRGEDAEGGECAQS